MQSAFFVRKNIADLIYCQYYQVDITAIVKMQRLGFAVENVMNTSKSLHLMMLWMKIYHIIVQNVVMKI